MIIGITGSIASGKTLVSQYLTEKGYRVLDSDVLSRQEMDKQETIEAIKVVFGSEVIVENRVDRKRLGRIIFENKEKRLMLNAIIHPKVIKALEDEKTKSQGLMFFDIPLLFESDLEYLVDKIIVVSVNKENQLSRLIERDQINRDYAMKKIESQMDIAQKIQKADYVIDNNGSVQNTIEQVDTILRRLKNEI